MRYLRVTFTIGCLVSLALIALHELGVLLPFDRALAASAALPVPAAELHPTLHYALIAGLAFAFAWTTIDIPLRPLKLVIAGGALAELIALFFVCQLYGRYFSPFAPALAVAASTVAGLGYAGSEIGQRKRLLRTVFGDRLSTKTFAALLNSPAPVNLAGELRQASIVVAEFYNHDDLLDVIPIPDCVAMINRFLHTASDFLVERGGCLDECGGESVQVIFGAPLDDPGHARTAALAALDLGKQLEALNREFLERWQQTLDFRIGVNSGEMITAAYGSHRLGSFTVAGEAVEFARRLCAANRIYGSRILIGSETYHLALDALEVRPIEMVRGRTDRVREEVYELLAAKGGLTDEELARRDAFWRGIVYYREQQLDEALAQFRRAQPGEGFDPPAHFYIRRVEHLRSGTAMQALEDEKF